MDAVDYERGRVTRALLDLRGLQREPFPRSRWDDAARSHAAVAVPEVGPIIRAYAVAVMAGEAHWYEVNDERGHYRKVSFAITPAEAVRRARAFLASRLAVAPTVDVARPIASAREPRSARRRGSGSRGSPPRRSEEDPSDLAPVAPARYIELDLSALPSAPLVIRDPFDGSPLNLAALMARRPWPDHSGDAVDHPDPPIEERRRRERVAALERAAGSPERLAALIEASTRGRGRPSKASGDGRETLGELVASLTYRPRRCMSVEQLSELVGLQARVLYRLRKEAVRKMSEIAPNSRGTYWAFTGWRSEVRTDPRGHGHPPMRCYAPPQLKEAKCRRTSATTKETE